MISALLGELAGTVTDAIASTGYIGVFIAMTIESCLIPLPSELIMPFAGFLSAQGKLQFGWAVIAGALGNLAGSILAYFIGHKISEKSLIAFLKKYGRFILVSPHEYNKAKTWLKKHGPAVSFLSRLIPGVRTVISLPAGVARINFAQFCIYTITGSLIWSALLCWLGFKLGQNWEIIGTYMHDFDVVILVAFMVIVGIYVWKKLSGFKKK